MVASGYSRVAKFAAVIILTSPVSARADTQPETPAIVRGESSNLAIASRTRSDTSTVDRTRRRPRGVWPRVFVPDPVAGLATREALDMARTLLEQPLCASVLTDFTDRDGHPLADRLDVLGVDVQTYLTLVMFIDDTRNPSCVTGTLARTAPGSRVVRLCSGEVKQTWQQDPAYTVAAFIHEMLHTLGLGENPPSSRQITRRVLARCRRE